MFRLFRYLICLLLFVTVRNTVHAQQYPLTSSTQIIPPYSVYLPDYTVPGSDKLRVILVQNDLTQPSYEVRLQMTVERNGTVIMRTAPTFQPKAISLSPGVPTIIGGADLYDYLQTNNITFSGGFSSDSYERAKSLPEGAYRITFTAFDYRRPQVQVSNAGANIFFFQKNDPPLLNLPICGSRVEKRDPQFLTFNWSSRNTPSPFADGGTEYIFSLYEIKPKGSNPDYIVRSARPIYTLTTESNTLVCGPGEPLLIDSMEYVWVVQARDKSGRDLYSNQGLSQSCRFTYLGNNPFAANNISKPALSGKATGERSIRLSWLPAPDNAAYQLETYRLQYRAAAKDGVTFDWITEEKQDTGRSLNSLEPGRMYEARLQWRIAGVYGPYSDLVKVSTDPLRTFNCGDGGATQQPSNTKPLLAAIPGMIIRIGHFDVLLTDVKGSDGTFTGRGRVITPGFGIGLLMEFKAISVNTDLVVTRGEMQALTEGIDKFVNDAVKEQRGGDDVGQVKTGDIVPDITTKLHIFTPAAIKVNTEDGTITLTDSQTQQQEVINYKDKGKTLPLVLEDADGNLYNIDKNGKVTSAGKRDSSLSGNAAALAALNTLELDKGKVTFAAATGNKYAFDAWKPEYAGKPVLDSSYESLSGGKYHVSAKAIVPGEQETVTATLENASADIDPAKLKFVSGKGIAYPFEKTGNTYTITITGGPAADAQEVFAVYPKGSGKYASMGKLLVSSYAPKQKKVILVPIGANTRVPQEAIRTSLERAYAKIGLTYTVETDESFRTDTTWDLDHNQVLQDSKSAFLSNGFTGEEKALKKAYKKKHTIDDNAVYLFLVNEAALSDGDLLGKMPRQSQFGFIFVKGAADENIGRTVSHEIGHGDHTLEHTFSAGIGLSKGSTDNLMDYNGSYGLLKYQWDVVHDPGSVWGIFEGDDESGEATVSNIEQLEPFKNKDGSFTFLTPAGRPLTLKGKLTQVSFVTAEDQWNISNTFLPLGTLFSFELDGKYYGARKIANSSSFTGYVDTLSKEPYVDELSAKKLYGQPIIGIPCIKDYRLVFKVFTTDYLDKNVAKKEVTAANKGEGTEEDVFFLSGYLGNEGNAQVIYAKMKPFTQHQLFFLGKYAESGNLCGMEALYAFRSAYLIGNNPGLLNCLQDAEHDSRAHLYQDYQAAMAALKANTIAADNTTVVNPRGEYLEMMTFFQEKRPDDKNFLKYMYNLLELYQQYMTKTPTEGLPDETMGNIIKILDLPNAGGRTCLLRNLPLYLRLALLEKHTAWTMTTSKEALMCDLIETTPDEDLFSLLEELAANNYKLMWSLYKDINGGYSDRFVSVLSMFVLKKVAGSEALKIWPPESHPTPAKLVTPYLHIVKEHTSYDNGVEIKYNTRAFGNDALTIIYTIGRSQKDGWGNTYYERSYTGTPFSFVRVRFLSDYQLPRLGEKGNIREGDDIIVPAIWAYWLLDRQSTIENWAAFRIVMDAGALVVSAATMEPGPLLAVEAAMGTTDIVVTMASDRIMSSDSYEMKSLVESWDAVYTVYGAGLITKAAVNGIAKFNIKTAGAAISAKVSELKATPEKLLKFVDDMGGMLQRLRSINIGSFDARNLFYSTVLHVYLEAKIATFTRNLQEVSLAVAQADQLVVRGLSKEIAIGTVVARETERTLLLTKLRWYKAGEHELIEKVIGRFEGILFVDEAGNELVGNLEMIVARDGQVYIRKAPAELIIDGKSVGRFTRHESLEIAGDENIYAGNLIALASNKTTTITGILDDVNTIAKRGVNADGTFNGITMANEANPGGINILRSPRWPQIKNKYKTLDAAGKPVYDWDKIADEFWNEVNRPWLDEAIARGDNFRFVSDPTAAQCIYITDDTGAFILDAAGNRKISIFGREIAYLKSKGYRILSNGTAVK